MAAYKDLDGDKVSEPWITIQHRPGARLELWSFLVYPEGIKAIYIDSVNSSRPELFEYETIDDTPTWIVDGQEAFRIERLPESREPYIIYPDLPQFYPDRFNISLEAQIEALFSGVDPDTVLEALIEIEDSPGLLCKPSWTCDRYYYIKGLAAELADDGSLALETYLHLWWNYTRSPYTTMARLKIRVPLPPTATQTATFTLTPVSTMTATATETQTINPNATATATPTDTSTPTETDTPDPNATATTNPYPLGTPTVQASDTPYPAP
jgi:hypothetical protein